MLGSAIEGQTTATFVWLYHKNRTEQLGCSVVFLEKVSAVQQVENVHANLHQFIATLNTLIVYLGMKILQLDFPAFYLVF